MREVQIYIEGQRLELFNDEIIQVTSSVQNVQDIAKVFTDFSQSFTVPASEHNNQIFQHFYESAVDGTIDHQLRRDARIEIDLVPFRTGKIQIEKSNLVKGSVQSYTITFYGDIRTLQDYFAEDKLSSLDLSAYVHTYSGAEIKTRITSNSNYDVRYPLISSDRVWTYGDNANTDISQNSHHIHYEELFPALRVSKIFEAIETKYAIDFQGLFLSDKRFTNLYLWCKNKEEYDNTSEKVFPFQSVTINPGQGGAYAAVYGFVVDQPNNTFRLKYNNAIVNGIDYGSWADIGVGAHKFRVVINKTTTPTLPGTFWLLVYKNGTLITTISSNYLSATNTLIDYTRTVNNEPSLDETYRFVIRSEVNETFNCFIQYQFVNDLYPDYPQIWESANINSNYSTVTFTNAVNLSGNMPDIKVGDFVSGILKIFNLTCTATNPTTFKIEPLESWYSQGRIIDVTKHIDIDSVDVQRVQLYKNISFKYQESESFMNQRFTYEFNRQYGNLEQTYEYDGTEYTIEVPFENLLHQKFTDTNVHVAYSLNTTFDSYIPKGVLLYMNEQATTDVSFYFNDGTSTTEITQYMPFGQDVIYNSARYSLNFGWDVSSYFLDVVNNNVFNTYYYNYLSNLYQRKNRLFYFKGLFPTPILTSLKLNDRLIIRDKRYIINEIKINLNTGEVDLVLLLDFRAIRSIKTPVIGKGIGSIIQNFFLPTKCVQLDIDVKSTGVVASKAQLTSDEQVTFTLPTLTEHYTLIAENSDDLISDEIEYFRSEEYNNVVYEIDLLYTFDDGTTETDIFTIIQEA